MSRPTRRAFMQAAGSGLFLPVAGQAFAQDAARDWPNRPIRLILGGSAGGSTDIINRQVTQKLGELWGQSFAIENVTGANGAIASDMVIRSVPNGYTLYGLSSSTHVGAAVGEKTPKSINYKTAFMPVTKFASQPYVLVVNASLPVNSVAELVAYAKKNPGKINYGSLGIGSATHLGTEMFKLMAGIDMVHVPYKGTNQVEQDLAANHVQMLFGGALSSGNMVQLGKTRALAVTSEKRSKLLPKLPTIAESGYPGFGLDAWFGLVAPAGTPQAVIDKAFRDSVKVLNAPELRDKLAAGGTEADPSDSPAAFGAFMDAETDKWEKFSKASGIRI